MYKTCFYLYPSNTYLDVSIWVGVWASWYVFQTEFAVLLLQSPEQLGLQVCTAVPSSSLFLILNL